MDGDHLGKLVNGETIGATWESAMHPEMRRRLKTPSFEETYRKPWEVLFGKRTKRLVTPAIHAAISESLGDFSIYGVTDIVKKNEGRLIYAGGDDVCAIMPVSTVVKAAREISEYYNSDFKLIAPNGPEAISSPWQPVKGKLSVNLGKSGGTVSISAGILVCHHKEGLSQMIARAHDLLQSKAKDEARRNACAIELKKRSGGSRFFTRKWDSTSWEAFEQIGELIRDGNQQVSNSLVYRMGCFRDGVDAILKKDNHKEMMAKFVEKQLDQSGIKPPKGRGAQVARQIVDIVISQDEQGNPVFIPEGLIVAGFIAGAEREAS